MSKVHQVPAPQTALDGNYGRDGWRAAMKILGLSRVIRNEDGSYSTADLPELVDLLREKIAKQKQLAPLDRVGEISNFEQALANLESTDG